MSAEQVGILFADEVWKPVVGYEGIYEVSDLGRLKRLSGTPTCTSERFLKGVPDKDGYLGVTLSKNNKKQNLRVHALVAEAFIGSRPFKHDINHIDGIKNNNKPTNLEYVTSSQNQYHALRTGLRIPPVGERHKGSKLKEFKVREILELQNSMTYYALAERYGVTASTIGDILCKRTWNHIGKDYLKCLEITSESMEECP